MAPLVAPDAVQTMAGGRPRLVPLAGRGEYLLVQTYSFLVAGTAWSVPAGYVYDGASIPSLIGLTWVATYSPHHPVVMRAALVHDYLCETRPRALRYAAAAALFRAMLLEDGAAPARAWMMFQAVLHCGPRW